jgi:hypothetical protein
VDNRLFLMPDVAPGRLSEAGAQTLHDMNNEVPSASRPQPAITMMETRPYALPIAVSYSRQSYLRQR